MTPDGNLNDTKKTALVKVNIYENKKEYMIVYSIPLCDLKRNCKKYYL